MIISLLVDASYLTYYGVKGLYNIGYYSYYGGKGLCEYIYDKYQSNKEINTESIEIKNIKLI